MERRLGRGLGSLLGSPQSNTPQTTVALDLIRANPHQPRVTFDDSGLEELRDSIRAHGVLQPIMVRRVGGGFELISGERRCRAAKLAGLTQIPAIVREDIGDEQMLELALVENVQRQDLDPLERAKGFRAMMESLHLTQEEVAAKVGLKRASVANHLRLLDLPAKVQEALARGLISMGHAKVLLALHEPRACLSILEETIRKDLSVREVEDRVRSATAPPNRGAGPFAEVPEKHKNVLVPWAADLQRRLEGALGTKVQLLHGPGNRGKIVIDYFSKEDLERVLEHIAPSPRL